MAGTPLWLLHAAPTTTSSIHQPNGLYIFNPCHLSGWGSMMSGERRIKFPNACFSSTGTPLIHCPSPLSHHSFSLLSFPITPCCFVPPLPTLSKRSYVFYLAIFISPSLPVALTCTPFFSTVASPQPLVLLPSLLFLPPPLPSSFTTTPTSLLST